MADCGVKSQPIRRVKTVSSNVETGEPLSQSSHYLYYNVYYLKGILNVFFVVLSKMEFRLGADINLLVLVCPLVFHIRWYSNHSVHSLSPSGNQVMDVHLNFLLVVKNAFHLYYVQS